MERPPRTTFRREFPPFPLEGVLPRLEVLDSPRPLWWPVTRDDLVLRSVLTVDVLRSRQDVHPPTSVITGPTLYPDTSINTETLDSVLDLFRGSPVCLLFRRKTSVDGDFLIRPSCLLFFLVGRPRKGPSWSFYSFFLEEDVTETPWEMTVPNWRTGDHFLFINNPFFHLNLVSPLFSYWSCPHHYKVCPRVVRTPGPKPPGLLIAVPIRLSAHPVTPWPSTSRRIR